MPFLTQFSGGRGGQNLTLLAGSGGVKTKIFGGVRGSKPKFFLTRFARRPNPPPPHVKKV